jgi:hypothetical protein
MPGSGGRRARGRDLECNHVRDERSIWPNREGQCGLLVGSEEGGIGRRAVQGDRARRGGRIGWKREERNAARKAVGLDHHPADRVAETRHCREYRSLLCRTAARQRRRPRCVKGPTEDCRRWDRAGRRHRRNRYGLSRRRGRRGRRGRDGRRGGRERRGLDGRSHRRRRRGHDRWRPAGGNEHNQQRCHRPLHGPLTPPVAHKLHEHGREDPRRSETIAAVALLASSSGSSSRLPVAASSRTMRA